MTHPAFVDMTGQRLGMLTVLARVPNHRNGGAQRECRCDCGQTCTKPGFELRARARRRSVMSCGCARRHRPRVPATPPAPRSGPRKPGKICDCCANLPARRPPTGCIGCGQPYAPDLVTIDQILELPQVDRRPV